jgi:hypothetical protein
MPHVGAISIHASSNWLKLGSTIPLFHKLIHSKFILGSLLLSYRQYFAHSHVCGFLPLSYAQRATYLPHANEKSKIKNRASVTLHPTVDLWHIMNPNLFVHLMLKTIIYFPGLLTPKSNSWDWNTFKRICWSMMSTAPSNLGTWLDIQICAGPVKNKRCLQNSFWAKPISKKLSW